MGKTTPKKQSFSLQSEILHLYRKFETTALRNVGISVGIVMTTVWITTAVAVYFFESSAKDSNIKSLADAIWWGIVTFLTVGYGDRFPVTTEGRFVGAFLMVVGVGCMGIITAKISSIFLEQALRTGRGFVDTNKLENHFIICGWNENMYDLLTHILKVNHELKSEDLVLIANIPPATIEALTSNATLSKLHFIVGDHFSEVNLRRAAPERAQKILILADRTPGPGGQPPTTTEVDARTIMTAMTIANISKGTLVTAEILDPKMDHYLKLAAVSEIIYSSEYSRLLLGNATSGTGIANIILDLLDGKSGAHITSVEIAESICGRPYAEVKELLEKQDPKILVIGILENSGNSHSIKELALRRAQQTPDMAQLVANLKGVKGIRCNHPIFNPSSDYTVRLGSMAIAISKRPQADERSNGEHRNQAAA